MSEVQLCHGWDGREIKFPILVEPKLDGLRCYIREGEAYSRMHKRLNNIEHISKLLSKHAFVFDGEIMARNWNDTITVVHTKYSVDAKDAVFHVFDMIPLDEWRESFSSQPQLARTQQLRKLITPENVPFIRPVECKVASNMDEINFLYQYYLKQGYEGIVIKEPSTTYRFRRHRSWQKIKPNLTEEFECIDVLPGTGKYIGMLGALLVSVAGATCGVGTGFTDQQRTELWQSPPIGKKIEVRYQEKTQDGVLRFPSFVRVRSDLE